MYPPGSRDHFVKSLGLPEIGQTKTKVWRRVVIGKDHYGLPCFRFLGLTSSGLETAVGGLRCATPAMMALANLLSHPRIGTETMSGPVAGRECLRSGKDLGRVLTIARLTRRSEIEARLALWLAALRHWFPQDWRALGRQAGSGLRELVADARALGGAWWTSKEGLPRGRRNTPDELVVVAEQLFQDLLEPLAARCGG